MFLSVRYEGANKKIASVGRTSNPASLAQKATT